MFDDHPPVTGCLALVILFSIFGFALLTVKSIPLLIFIAVIFFPLSIYFGFCDILYFIMARSVAKSEKTRTIPGKPLFCRECESMAYPIEGPTKTYRCEYCGHEFRSDTPGA